MPVCFASLSLCCVAPSDLVCLVIAGFFTGGALAVRGGVKAARNSAIMCAVFLAVIEGVGIGFQRMMADNTKLEVCGHASGQIEDSIGDGQLTRSCV